MSELRVEPLVVALRACTAAHHTDVTPPSSVTTHPFSKSWPFPQVSRDERERGVCL